MRLRAKVSFDGENDVWLVHLWVHPVGRDFPRFFGQRVFGDWNSALSWALWRVRASHAYA